MSTIVTYSGSLRESRQPDMSDFWPLHKVEARTGCAGICLHVESLHTRATGRKHVFFEVRSTPNSMEWQQQPLPIQGDNRTQ